ncbi:MAG: PIN domain-containing protein [Nitrososphaerota archaeon]|nr:PIN domain-containing protein [Nitrososphaerota archaeon]
MAEILEIMEARLSLKRAIQFLEKILTIENIRVEGVQRKDYEEALVIASRYKVSPSDAATCVISRKMNVSEIYSFDKHFDNIPFVKRIY